MFFNSYAKSTIGENAANELKKEIIPKIKLVLDCCSSLILSLSFAFRDVWENLYQTVNLLFIDELIDSGMDAAGVEAGLAVLKKMARERNKNIYLISHKDELIGRVNNVLRVVKENGFTNYSNDVDFIEA